MRAPMFVTRWVVIWLVVLGAPYACGDSGGGDDTCPCSDGCTGTTCNIDCGQGECSDRTITCPPDVPCVLTCTGLDACDTTIVQCPTTADCTVTCEGTDACGDMELRCGAGTCTMACGTNVDSCTGAVVECGTGACTATCAGSTPPTVNCGSASSCTPC